MSTAMFELAPFFYNSTKANTYYINSKRKITIKYFQLS